MISANVIMKGIVKVVQNVEGKEYRLIQVETMSSKGFGDFSTIRDFSGIQFKAGQAVELPCVAKAYVSKTGNSGLSLDHYKQNTVKG